MLTALIVVVLYLLHLLTVVPPQDISFQSKLGSNVTVAKTSATSNGRREKIIKNDRKTDIRTKMVWYKNVTKCVKISSVKATFF